MFTLRAAARTGTRCVARDRCARVDAVAFKAVLAGEKYRGSRFDWNGFAVSARFRGVELLGEEKPRFQRNPAIFGRGLNNEFGIKKCVGYDDCAVGEWFPKIGTGWLRKDDKPYFFYNQYELDPVSFSSDVSSDRTRATFTCESGERNGYAYRYVKKYSLDGASFRISYELENLGTKPIDTDKLRVWTQWNRGMDIFDAPVMNNTYFGNTAPKAATEPKRTLMSCCGNGLISPSSPALWATSPWTKGWSSGSGAGAWS